MAFDGVQRFTGDGFIPEPVVEGLATWHTGVRTGRGGFKIKGLQVLNRQSQGLLRGILLWWRDGRTMQEIVRKQGSRPFRGVDGHRRPSVSFSAEVVPGSEFRHFPVQGFDEALLFRFLCGGCGRGDRAGPSGFSCFALCRFRRVFGKGFEDRTVLCLQEP